MSEKGFQFRTAAFGGFQKQDVLAYLEANTREHTEKIAALRREAADAQKAREELQEKLAALEGRMATLEAENQRLAADLADRETALTQITARRDTLEEQTVNLSREVERLSPEAASYEAIKDRTASIELEAHGRARAIELEAQGKVKRSRDQLLAWFDQLQASYERLRSDLDATLGQTMRELGRAGQNLEVIAGELTGHDETLKQLKAQVEAVDGPKAPTPLPLDEE